MFDDCISIAVLNKPCPRCGDVRVSVERFVKDGSTIVTWNTKPHRRDRLVILSQWVSK